MKLTIITEDKSVYKDKKSFQISDMSFIPSNIHALQFDNEINIGHIEYKDLPNEQITKLPNWAVTAIQMYDTELVAYEAEQAAIIESYKASQEAAT
jgi:hypothetical protein